MSFKRLLDCILPTPALRRGVTILIFPTPLSVFLKSGRVYVDVALACVHYTHFIKRISLSLPLIYYLQQHIELYRFVTNFT